MNKPTANEVSSLYEWLDNAQSFTQQAIFIKYAELFRILQQSFNFDKDKTVTIMIVGGGACDVEKKIIEKIGLNNVKIIAVDYIKPSINKSSVYRDVKWIPGGVSKELICENNIKADIVICLGTSRYFENASEMYAIMMGVLVPGGLVVLDFYQLPYLRQATTNVMREWVKIEWNKDNDKIKKKLNDLVLISQALSEQLGEASVHLEYGIKELGIEPGTIKLQQLIYESLFPFWFRGGMSQTEMAAQLVWMFLPKSHNNTIDVIEKFACDNELIIDEIHEIGKDTRVLIAKKSATIDKANQ